MHKLWLCKSYCALIIILHTILTIWTFPCFEYFVVYCLDCEQILEHRCMVQHSCMQSNIWNRIHIVWRFRFPSSGFKSGKVCIIMIREATCSKPLCYLCISLYLWLEKLNYSPCNDITALQYIQILWWNVFCHVQVPGHLFANESPRIS